MSATATRLLPFLCSVLLLAAEPAEAVSPTATPPTPSPFAGAASATPTGTPRPPASATRTYPSASPTVGSRRSDVGGSETAPDGTAADDGSARPAATAAVARPRVFRTPERAAPPAFVAPGGAAEEGDGMAAPDVPEPAVGNRPPAPRAGSGLVVFHVTARTALEGFDLRVAYPRSLGAFGNSAKQAECNAGTGALVVANDHGGTLQVLVASATALPLPLDVFCRFTLEPGAGLDAGAFTVRVAEVTSDGKRADPALLLVSVFVR